MIEIINLNDSRIRHYRNLKGTPRSHLEESIFIAEGHIVTKKLLESNIEVLSFFALPEFYSIFHDLIKSKNIPSENLLTANKNLMKEIVGYKLHSGIMAIGHTPPSSSLKDLKPPIVILNGIVNSENVGSIVRNAAAFGINSIIYDKETSSPYLRRAVRVSMGTIFEIDYYSSQNLFDDLMYLKNEKQYQILSAELTKQSKSIDNFTFPDNPVIIFGSEGKGIDKNILTISDNIIHIPISPKIDSLNVAASSAIIFHHIKIS